MLPCHEDVPSSEDEMFSDAIHTHKTKNSQSFTKRHAKWSFQVEGNLP